MQVVDRLPGFVCHLLAELDHLGEDDLLFGGEEADATDLLEVHANGVVDARRFRDRLHRIRLRDLGRSFRNEECRRSLRAEHLDSIDFDFGEIRST